MIFLEYGHIKIVAAEVVGIPIISLGYKYKLNYGTNNVRYYSDIRNLLVFSPKYIVLCVYCNESLALRLPEKTPTQELMC